MPAKLPYQKWFWGDWFRDTRCLTALARGVWIDVIGYLRESTSTGSATWDKPTWCRLLTLTPEEFDFALVEFEKFAICTVVPESDGRVTLTARRIRREKRAIRDNKLRQREHRSNKAVTDESQPGGLLNHSHSQKHSQSHSQKQIPPNPPRGASEVAAPGQGKSDKKPARCTFHGPQAPACLLPLSPVQIGDRKRCRFHQYVEDLPTTVVPSRDLFMAWWKGREQPPYKTEKTLDELWAMSCGERAPASANVGAGG